MQLYDKDLLSVQEVRELVETAKKAQKIFAEMSQEQVDAVVKSVAMAGLRNAKRLAKMAHEETGFGKEDDKVIKNVFGSYSVYESIKDEKTIGEIEYDAEHKIHKIAVPVGIIAGLIPSTNPTSTVFFKSEIALKSGNAIIFSPHPNAQNCIFETVKVIREAIAEAGAPEDLVSVISIPTQEATACLMKHPDVALILATGGSAMVHAAYSSGTPAIGVGPGNGPAYIEKSADVAAAVKKIIESKTFDNGVICASEQSVVCDRAMEAKVREEMEKQGAYFLDDAQIAKLSKFILRANGTMNPAIVGKSAQAIATLADIKVPDWAKVLVAKETGIGPGHPYSKEKLCPILAFFVKEDYKEVCTFCDELLRFEGAGHTFSIHSQDPAMVEYFAKRIPASRICVNTPSALGGIGATTALVPSLTLGCGAIGGSATSENVGPANLLNVKYVAEEVINYDDLRASAGKILENNACCANQDLANVDVDALVSEIVKRLREL